MLLGRNGIGWMAVAWILLLALAAGLGLFAVPFITHWMV